MRHKDVRQGPGKRSDDPRVHGMKNANKKIYSTSHHHGPEKVRRERHASIWGKKLNTARIWWLFRRRVVVLGSSDQTQNVDLARPRE
mmetsp:Transcript_7515/g.17903  ORF Transcript_7515/g.17903 Transcript_7515/m.17903 type:complete len:87 (+) Transcript_7515:390-650(+)